VGDGELPHEADSRSRAAIVHEPEGEVFYVLVSSKISTYDD
jgi:hypothetical protein